MHYTAAQLKTDSLKNAEACFHNAMIIFPVCSFTHLDDIGKGLMTCITDV